MRIRRNLRRTLVPVALTIAAALPTAAAAQTQRVPATSPQSGAGTGESSGAKSIVLPDARTQAALEKRAQSLEQQVAALQASEARMQKALLALQRTVATVEATALPVQRQGANYIVTVPAGLTLHGASVTIQGDAGMTLKASSAMAISATAVDITAQARMGLKSTTISLNAGSNGRGAARAGDQTSCDAGAVCTIATASSSVLIGS